MCKCTPGKKTLICPTCPPELQPKKGKPGPRGKNDPPKSWEAFLEKQADIHEAKEADYGSRFMQGLLTRGRVIWEWEVEKKVERVRTWVERGTLAVKGEGVANAVGDAFNYTVQYVIYGLYGQDALDKLSREDFLRIASSHSPNRWIGLLVSSGLITADETEVQQTFLKFMGVNE